MSWKVLKSSAEISGNRDGGSSHLFTYQSRGSTASSASNDHIWWQSKITNTPFIPCFWTYILSKTRIRTYRRMKSLKSLRYLFVCIVGIWRQQVLKQQEKARERKSWSSQKNRKVEERVSSTDIIFTCWCHARFILHDKVLTGWWTSSMLSQGAVRI